jgi:hypothetical protein
MRARYFVSLRDRVSALSSAAASDTYRAELFVIYPREHAKIADDGASSLHPVQHASGVLCHVLKQIIITQVRGIAHEQE